MLDDKNELSIRGRLSLLVANLATLVGLTWLLRAPFKNLPIYDRMGYLCAVLCLSGLFVFLITAYWLGFVKKYGWSPFYCQKQGFYMTLYLVMLFLGFDHTSLWLAVSLGLSIGVLSGLVLRRLAYPTLADEQLYSSKQLPRVFPS
ncbi:MAG: hypothetical protein WA020_15625 [Candidatus Acidiferrales bacterium]